MSDIKIEDVLHRLETETEEIKNTDSERLARQDICNSCDKKNSLLNVDYCNQCGCILLFKTAFRYARCPLNKWEASIPPFVISK